MFQTNQGQKNAGISKSGTGEVDILYLINRLGQELQPQSTKFQKRLTAEK